MSIESSPPALCAVVTGGGSGIGLALSRLLLERGAHVHVIDLAVEPARGLAASHHGRLELHRASVTDETALRDVLERIHSGEASRVNALVNCAGIPPNATPIEDYALADWSRVIDSHLNGTYLCCQIFGSDIAARQACGSIVNVASVLAFRPGPVLAYGAAKSAIVNLTQSLAAHWAASGVRVNAVAPGWTDTPFVRRKDRSMGFDAILQATPQRRLLQPTEIAEVIFFLLSPVSSAVTGSTLVCDGGYMAGAGWSPYGGIPGHPRSRSVNGGAQLTPGGQ
jgi:NAD(P)-dependent dehydrogenase (short-subunit alcohol dehydrogenase family)